MEHLGGYTDEQIKRVCYLIGHHHTYHDIDGLDYQILVEADFLVNIYEDNIPADHAKIVRGKIFRTATGKKLLDEMFLHERDFKPGQWKTFTKCIFIFNNSVVGFQTIICAWS